MPVSYYYVEQVEHQFDGLEEGGFELSSSRP